MKLLWTLLKVALGLVVLIPVGLLMLGLFGVVLAFAMVALRLAVIGLLAFGAFRLATRLIRGPAQRLEPKASPRLSGVDPYYQAAMKELDRDLA